MLRKFSPILNFYLSQVGVELKYHKFYLLVLSISITRMQPLWEPGLGSASLSVVSPVPGIGAESKAGEEVGLSQVLCVKQQAQCLGPGEPQQW